MANSYIRNFLAGKAFFDLFNQTGTNIVSMAELLGSIFKIESFQERVPVFEQIDTLEETGDDLSHRIYLMLDKIPFPPLNRGDIYALASAIDDVADYIQEATNRMHLYKLEDLLVPMQEIAAHLLQACQELNWLLHGLKKVKDVEQMLESCRKIKQEESLADKIYYSAIALLFEQEQDAISLLKKREILHSLETAVNKCKSAADVIESVVIKKL